MLFLGLGFTKLGKKYKFDPQIWIKAVLNLQILGRGFTQDLGLMSTSICQWKDFFLIYCCVDCLALWRSQLYVRVLAPTRCSMWRPTALFYPYEAIDDPNWQVLKSHHWVSLHFWLWSEILHLETLGISFNFLKAQLCLKIYIIIFYTAFLDVLLQGDFQDM